MVRLSDKRESLIESATKLFHQAGFKDTSIADIAEDSGVPLGNVYYYFKTKDDLAAAVIKQRTEIIKARAKKWEENPDPKARLLNLLDMHESMKNETAKYGCPIGSMCQELDKERPPVANEADGLMNWVLKWIDQFGLQLMSALQGCAVVANALKDPKVIELEMLRLRSWIKEL
jgi:AcrR family transcriptional regulator